MNRSMTPKKMYATKTTPLLALLCALGALSPVQAGAQTPPVLPPAADPGLQQQDRLHREKLQREREQLAPRPAGRGDAAKADESGPAFTLQRVRFSNSRHLSREQLTAVAQPFLGRELRMAGLQQLLDAVNELYRSQGIYTAAATLPPQQVRDGTVVIQLVEGRLGQVHVEQNRYLDGDWVRRWVGEPAAGSDLDARRLEADVARFNRVNEAKLQAALRAGQDFGLTDLVLGVQEPARLAGQLFVDNHGYESSGRAEIGGVLRGQRLLLDGDRALAYVLASAGARALSLSYNAPVGASGVRLGASVALNRSHLTAAAYRDTDVRGAGRSATLEGSWLAWSGASSWLSLTAQLQSSNSSNAVKGVAVSDYAIDRLGVGAPLTVTGAGWQWSFGPSLTLARARNRLLDGDTRRIGLFGGDSQLLARLGDGGWYGLGQLSWQASTGKALPGALAFSVGGPASVRGFAAGSFSGDRGLTASGELHYDGWAPAQTRVDAYAFLDTSAVATPLGTVHPTGAGFGVNWSGWQDLTLGATAARGLRGSERREWQFHLRLAAAF